MNPIYDELVVKYYLSKGIVPFSYPHVKFGEQVKARQIIGRISSTDTHGNPHIKFDLHATPVVNNPKRFSL